MLLSGCGEADDSAPEAIEPSEDCQFYVACAVAADPANAELYENTYGDGGECWSGSSGDALSCTQECQAGIDTIGYRHPLVEECWRTGEPEAAWIFAVYPVWAYMNVQGECYDATGTFAATAPGSDFGLTILYESGAVWTVSCSLGRDFAFDCDPMLPDDVKHYISGTFDAQFESGTLKVQDDDPVDCVWDGFPSG